jgi:hypothetical protein
MQNDKWLHLNFNQIVTSRQTRFITSRDNNLIVSLNNLNNRMQCLNGSIPVDWLNLNLNAYTIECKKSSLLFDIFIEIIKI